MRIAVPNEGRLHEPTIELLERAGLYLDNGIKHKPYAGTADPDAITLFTRATDIPEYVRDGTAEVSITRLDQIHESSHELEDLLDLEYGKYRFVLATPEDSDTKAVAGVSGKVVAIGPPHIARTYFEEEGVDAETIEVTGAAELTPHVEMVNAIIGIMLTRTTLRVSRLVVIDEVLSSSVRLSARPDMVGDPRAR